MLRAVRAGGTKIKITSIFYPLKDSASRAGVDGMRSLAGNEAGDLVAVFARGHADGFAKDLAEVVIVVHAHLAGYLRHGQVAFAQQVLGALDALVG